MRVGAITNMYPTPAFPAQGTFIERQVAGLRQLGVDVRLLFVPRVGGGRLVYADLFGKVRRFVRQERPEVIHVMYGGALARIALSAAANVQAVVSFCGSDLLGEPGCKSWRRWLGDCVVRASRAAARRADGIIVKSAGLQRALPAEIAPERVWVIPNGVDLDQFRPMDQARCRRELGWETDDFLVLFAGAPSNPTKRFVLAQVTVDTLRIGGVPARLKVMTGAAHDAVPLWLNAADALLLCSLHEGSPNIVKEALACNRPIVAVDVGDVRERIEGVEGCHLAAAEAEDLARKLCMVYEGPRVVDGRTRMRDLSILAVAERVRHVYQAVLSLPRSVTV